MKLQKPWEKDQKTSNQDKPEKKSTKVIKVKYEVVQKFNHKGRRINPGGKLPDKLSEATMAKLINRGVLRALKE